MIRIPRLCLPLLLVASGCIAAGCTAHAPGANSENPQAARPVEVDRPPSPDATPATVADLFPPGVGRDDVLNNCGSCHNLACASIGQRTSARWDALEESHKEKVPGAEVDVMFWYLKAHFNDSQPEPKVPPRFLEGGCTPF